MMVDPDDIKSCPTQASERSSADSAKNATISVTQASTADGSTAQLNTTSRRTLSVNKALDELFTAQEAEENKETSKKAKKDRKNKRSRSVHIRNKPTPLTFFMLEDKPHIAICQLVLCNISERSLNFKIKCSPGGNIVAAPVGNAHIAPHAQVRLRLTWTKVDSLANWDELESPKLLLITNFLDENNEIGDSDTQTRLVARISLAKKCSAVSAPVEQLLLDAVGKSTEVNPFQKPMSAETTGVVATPVNNNNLSRQLADFINSLTDRGLIILACIFIAIFLLFK